MQLRIDVSRGRIDIHQHRTRAAIRNGLGRSKKSVGSRDHFVISLDAERQKSYVQRRSSTGESHAVFGAAEVGELALKSFDFFAENKR